MAVTTGHSQPGVYSRANGQEHYAFDDFQEIGTSFVPISHPEISQEVATPSLRICYVDTSVKRAARVAHYLRSYAHDVTEPGTTDDIFDALLSQEYDVLLVGCVGVARVPLIRSVKELVAGYDKATRVAVISTNETINRELLAAGADDVVDADTDNPFFNAILCAAFEYAEPVEPLIEQPTEQTHVEESSPRMEAPAPIVATAARELVAEPPHADSRPAENDAAAKGNILEALHKQVQQQNAHSHELHFPNPTQDTPVNFAHVAEPSAKSAAPVTLPKSENSLPKADVLAKEEAPPTPRAEKPKSKRDDSNKPAPAPRPDPVFVAVEKARKGEIDLPAQTSHVKELVWMLGMIPGKVPVALLALAWVIVELVMPGTPNM